MKAPRTTKGPWIHQLLIGVFTVLFGLLIYWLSGFVMRDIATWPGPDYSQVATRFTDAGLAKEAAALTAQIAETQRATSTRKQRQAVLRDSTSNSEKTMNQLLELQRLTLQKGLAPPAEEAKALAESQRLFLANQTKYQEMNDQIAALAEELDKLEDRQRVVAARLEVNRPTIQAEFARLQSAHQFKLAAAKLGVVVPLLVLAVWLFRTRRHNLYAPLIHGFGLAVLVRGTVVLHEHFPRRYFKYILIVIAIALVASILVCLLRAVAFPKVEWLLKRYREAYEHFLCPVCNHPIRRGPLKDLFWTRSSLKKLRVPAGAVNVVDEPYVCPVCATRLFEPCTACQQIRHALLPACTHCGDEKPILPAGAKSS
jgi:hypothetical protein